MNGFLTDTNVISEFALPEPNEGVARWLAAADPDSLFAGVITFGEIRPGIENLPSSKRRARLEEWLDREMPAWFESNLLPITRDIAGQWARISIRSKKRGRQISTADDLIAATALVHGLTLVTRNGNDFIEAGVDLFNPWNRDSTGRSPM